MVDVVSWLVGELLRVSGKEFLGFLRASGESESVAVVRRLELRGRPLGGVLGVVFESLGCRLGASWELFGALGGESPLRLLGDA